MEKEKRDIWSEGVKSILGFHKKTLLDFIDALERETTEPKERERLGKIKGRIHNDLSQAYFSVGVLLETMRRGGDITPFEANIFGRPESYRNRRKERIEGRIFNTSLRKGLDGIQDKSKTD